MTFTYEDFLKDREEMPVYDESIFYPKREIYKLGLNDEDIEYVVQYFRWLLDQQNRQQSRLRIILLLKLRMKNLIHQKQSELYRELEALKKFSR